MSQRSNMSLDTSVSRELSEKGQMNSPTLANEIDNELKRTILKIRVEENKLGGEYIAISEKICENCENQQIYQIHKY